MAVGYLLAQLEARLARDDDPIPPVALRELTRGLETLGRRIARAEEMSAERTAGLRATLGRLEWRLEVQSAQAHVLTEDLETRVAARLQALEAEVAETRAAARGERVLLRILLWAASALAALSVVGAFLQIAGPGG